VGRNENGQNFVDSSTHSDSELTACTVRGSNRGGENVEDKIGHSDTVKSGTLTGL